MKDYYTMQTGVSWDDLIGGESIAVRVENIKLADGESVERGALLARGSNGYYKNVEDTDDAAKYMVIARDGATSLENRVISAYSMGTFNQNKIKIDENLDIEDFELALRQQGIRLTNIVPVYEDAIEEEEEETGSDTPIGSDGSDGSDGSNGSE